MMKNLILLVSKDVLMREYLPIYGNTFYNTPNIDELASKGTVFLKHYTAAPSTAMAFTSMFTGLYPYETDRHSYVEVSDYQGDTFFDDMHGKGYSCHIVWDESYIKLAHKFSKCYGRDTTIHSTNFLTKKQPPHIKGKYDDTTFFPELEDMCVQKMEELTREICGNSDKVFMWVHFPHALLGRNAYGSDIDMVDRMVGMLRKYFSDDAIYITADHGHMNGAHGKFGYGFDLYQEAILIPFISPRIEGLSTVDFPTSNTQLAEIIQGEIKKRDIVFSETAYYMQSHRKLAIIDGDYKYIFEKKSHKEFLFDTAWDPMENINLLATEIYDTDRNTWYSQTQRTFYPWWFNVYDEARKLRAIKDGIWKNAPWYIEMKERILFYLKNIYSRLKK